MTIDLGVESNTHDNISVELENDIRTDNSVELENSEHNDICDMCCNDFLTKYSEQINSCDMCCEGFLTKLYPCLFWPHPWSLCSSAMCLCYLFGICKCVKNDEKKTVHLDVVDQNIWACGPYGDDFNDYIKYASENIEHSPCIIINILVIMLCTLMLWILSGIAINLFVVCFLLILGLGIIAIPLFLVIIILAILCFIAYFCYKSICFGIPAFVKTIPFSRGSYDNIELFDEPNYV